jgi:pullulanase
VDGPSVFVYGEGWNFGEVADNARGVNATQLNMAGTGIGTFSDRLRDAVRGGNPFGGWQEQGFANGLFTFPNEIEERTPEEQSERLFLFMDQIRLGLAGNLAAYPVVTATGETILGEDVDYNGQPAGYTLDPQEHIVYASAHDNETIFDATQLKAPLAADMDTRVRMVHMANAIVMFSQGVPFFHAGDDMLRSKSLDRNSYNSGDWYNAIDWTMNANNWGHGLPPASDNADQWDIMQPLLANPELAATPEQIQLANSMFMELLQIRRDHPLFRLQTAEDVLARVSFLAVGEEQIPGLIAMVLDDRTGENLDAAAQRIVVVFNASPETQSVDVSALGAELVLHPILAESADAVVREAAYADGAVTVPAFTTAVFFQPE